MNCVHRCCHISYSSTRFMSSYYYLLLHSQITVITAVTPALLLVVSNIISGSLLDLWFDRCKLSLIFLSSRPHSRCWHRQCPLSLRTSSMSNRSWPRNKSHLFELMHIYVGHYDPGFVCYTNITNNSHSYCTSRCQLQWPAPWPTHRRDKDKHIVLFNKPNPIVSGSLIACPSPSIAVF